ncbi:23791_t:CDS:2, partial [Racocetra persica]
MTTILNKEDKRIITTIINTLYKFDNSNKRIGCYEKNDGNFIVIYGAKSFEYNNLEKTLTEVNQDINDLLRNLSIEDQDNSLEIEELKKENEVKSIEIEELKNKNKDLELEIEKLKKKIEGNLIPELSTKEIERIKKYFFLTAENLSENSDDESTIRDESSITGPNEHSASPSNDINYLIVKVVPRLSFSISMMNSKLSLSSTAMMNDGHKIPLIGMGGVGDNTEAPQDKTTQDVILWALEPGPQKRVKSYKTLQELVKQGKVRSIGVSNYGVKHLKELMNIDPEIIPAVNQIE